MSHENTTGAEPDCCICKEKFSYGRESQNTQCVPQKVHGRKAPDTAQRSERTTAPCRSPKQGPSWGRCSEQQPPPQGQDNPSWRPMPNLRASCHPSKDIKVLRSHGVARSDILMVPSEIGTHKKAAAFLEKPLLVNNIRNSSTSFPLICISRRLFSTFYQNITESR